MTRGAAFGSANTFHNSVNSRNFLRQMGVITIK